MTEKKKPRRPRGSGGIRNRGTERNPRWFAFYELVVDTNTRQVTKGPSGPNVRRRIGFGTSCSAVVKAGPPSRPT
jgi:hypothetical protein